MSRQTATALRLPFDGLKMTGLRVSSFVIGVNALLAITSATAFPFALAIVTDTGQRA
jgi:hypothetical protein